MPGSEQVEQDAVPKGVDISRASIARVYDAFLGGKDNYEVDRAVYQAVLQVAPESRRTARAIRAWMVRAVRWLSGPAGMNQFLDCGSGLPTMENTHECAQRMNPDSRVVYVDNDPIVAAHGQALLEENENTHFVVGDLTKPAELLKNPVVTSNLDLDEPYVLMQCNTLHHLMDDQRPGDIMTTYIDALPRGSYVVLCHFYDAADGSEFSELARETERRFQESSMGTGRFRTRVEILSYLNGLELVEPGLVKLHEWWPNGPRLEKLATVDHLLLCGVARKP